LHVRFDEAQRGVSPGQAIVLYADDVALGGGRIAVTESTVASWV